MIKHFLLTILIGLFHIGSHAEQINIQHWQTHNGTKVLFVQQTELPMVDINIAFPAGAAYDKQNWGIANLTANLLDQGANGLNATQIAERFENYGAQFSTDVDRDKASFSLRTLSHKESLKNSVDTLGLILSQPDFNPQVLTREKQKQLTSIQYMAEKPSVLASNTFYKVLYKDQPYGHPVLGNSETVQKIDTSLVRAFHKQHYTSNGAIIALVGNLNAHQARVITENLSSKLPSQATANLKSTATAKVSAEHKKIFIPFPSNQTSIVIGQIGINHHNPHYFPLIVGNYILGGSGLISRLAEEVREKRGLTYGVYSSFQMLSTPAPFTISLATQTSQAQQALQVTLNTLNKYLKEGPTTKELIAAKQYLTGSFPLSLSSNKSLASILLSMGYYNLPLNYLNTYLDNINKVELSTIKQAFTKVIKPTELLTVMVGRE